MDMTTLLIAVGSAIAGAVAAVLVQGAVKSAIAAGIADYKAVADRLAAVKDGFTGQPTAEVAALNARIAALEKAAAPAAPAAPAPVAPAVNTAVSG